MLLQGQIGLGAGTKLPDGQQTNARQGNQGDLIVSELHGRYYEQAYRKALFNAANQAGVTSSAALSTTFVGAMLYNPISSSVNLVVNKFGYAIVVAPAAVMAVGLATGFNGSSGLTSTTALTVRNNFVNGPAGQGQAFSAATLPTAAVIQNLIGTMFTTASSQGTQNFDLEGSLIIPPGGYVCSYTSVASGSSGFLGSFSWEEVPL